MGVFVVEEDPDIRTGKKIALGSYRTLLQDGESSGEEDSEVEEEPVHLEFEDDSGPASIETKNYGTINFRAAETLLLNGMVEEVPFLQSPESPNLLGTFLELSRIFDCTDRTSVAARQQ